MKNDLARLFFLFAISFLFVTLIIPGVLGGMNSYNTGTFGILLAVFIIYIAVHVVAAYFLPFKNTKKIWISWLLVLVEALIFYLIITFFSQYDKSCTYPPGVLPPEIPCARTTARLVFLLEIATMFNLVCVTISSTVALVLNKVSKKKK